MWFFQFCFLKMDLLKLIFKHVCVKVSINFDYRDRNWVTYQSTFANTSTAKNNQFVLPHFAVDCQIYSLHLNTNRFLFFWNKKEINYIRFFKFVHRTESKQLSIKGDPVVLLRSPEITHQCYMKRMYNICFLTSESPILVADDK